MGGAAFHPIINRIYFGCWTNDNFSEELVVCPISDNEYEIHCHGGVTASRQIIKSLVNQGATEVATHEWTELRRLDRFAIEAQQLLPFVQTEQQLEIVLVQLNGAMRNQLLITMAALRKGDTRTASIRLQRIIQGRPLLSLKFKFVLYLVHVPTLSNLSRDSSDH